MEQPPEKTEQQQRDEDMGEDHRESPPGYDLDEQQAIEDLKRERTDDE